MEPVNEWLTMTAVAAPYIDFDKNGIVKLGKTLQVFWKGPGFKKEEIPASVLYHKK